MKNKLFAKTTALVMGSLIIFSGQALAISSNNNQELTNAEALGESELLIAADSDTLTEQDKKTIAIAVGNVENVLGDAIVATQAVAIPQGSPLKDVKDAIAISLGKAKTVLGTSVAQTLAVAKTKGEAKAIAQAIGETESVIGDAITKSTAIAKSPGGSSLAKALGTAKTTAGTAVAEVTAIAQ